MGPAVVGGAVVGGAVVGGAVVRGAVVVGKAVVEPYIAGTGAGAAMPQGIMAGVVVAAMNAGHVVARTPHSGCTIVLGNGSGSAQRESATGSTAAATILWAVTIASSAMRRASAFAAIFSSKLSGFGNHCQYMHRMIVLPLISGNEMVWLGDTPVNPRLLSAGGHESAISLHSQPSGDPEICVTISHDIALVA